MPIIPEYQSQGGISPVADNPAPIGLGDAASKGQTFAATQAVQSGKEMAGMGLDVMKAGETVQDTLDKYDASKQLADAHVAITAGLNQKATDLSTDPDWKNHMPQFTAYAQDLKQQTLDGMDNPIARANFESAWANTYASTQDTVYRQAQKVAIKVFHAGVLENQDALETQVGKAVTDIATTPGMVPADQVTQINGVIDSLGEKNDENIARAVAAGIYDPDVAFKMTKKFKEDAQYALARAVTLSNPTLALQMLTGGDIKINDPLKVDQITKQIQTGIQIGLTRQDMLLRRDELEAEKQVKIDQSNATKNVYLMANQGKLDEVLDAFEQDPNNRLYTPEAVHFATTLASTERKTQVDLGRKVLENEFHPQNFEGKVNPTDPQFSAAGIVNGGALLR